jgi:hypothetical protein
MVTGAGIIGYVLMGSVLGAQAKRLANAMDQMRRMLDFFILGKVIGNVRSNLIKKFTKAFTDY